MQVQPLVSVIIPCYNGAKFIEKTLESVYNQTYKNFEVIIVDDGSADNTKDIILNKQYKNLKYLYQKNAGVSCARNKAIEESKGEYLAFIDQDDIWYPEKLEKQINQLLGTNSDLAFCITYENFVMRNQKRIMHSEKKNLKWLKNPYNSIIIDSFIPMLTSVVKKDFIIEKKIFFNTNYKLEEDWDFFIRIITGGGKVTFVNEPLCEYTVHEKNLSIIEVQRMREEAIDIMKNSLEKFKISKYLKFRLHRKIALFYLANARDYLFKDKNQTKKYLSYAFSYHRYLLKIYLYYFISSFYGVLKKFFIFYKNLIPVFKK